MSFCKSTRKATKIVSKVLQLRNPRVNFSTGTIIYVWVGDRMALFQSMEKKTPSSRGGKIGSSKLAFSYSTNSIDSVEQAIS